MLSPFLIALQPGTSSGGPCLPTLVGPVHQPLTCRHLGGRGEDFPLHQRLGACGGAGGEWYFDFKLDLVAQSKQVAGISKKHLSLLRPHHCPGTGHPHGKERRRRMTASGTSLQADMLTSSLGPGPPLSDWGGSARLSHCPGCQAVLSSHTQSTQVSEEPQEGQPFPRGRKTWAQRRGLEALAHHTAGWALVTLLHRPVSVVTRSTAPPLRPTAVCLLARGFLSHCHPGPGLSVPRDLPSAQLTHTQTSAPTCGPLPRNCTPPALCEERSV